MPGGGFSFRQVSMGQRVGQIPAEADLFTVRYQAGDGRAVFEQNESDVLIMRAVDAIGKIARSVRHADTRLTHKIRLSDFSPWVNPLRQRPPGVDTNFTNVPYLRLPRATKLFQPWLLGD